MACLWMHSPSEQMTRVQNSRVAPTSPDASGILGPCRSSWASSLSELSLRRHYSFLQMPLAPDTLEHSRTLQFPGPPPTFPPLTERCPQPGSGSPRLVPLVSPVTVLLLRRPWSVQHLRFKCESWFHHLLAEGPWASRGPLSASVSSSVKWE